MRGSLPGLLILALLVLPAALWLAGVEGGIPENQAPTRWPSPALQSISSAEYFNQVEDAVQDRLPLKDLAVRSNSEALLRLLGESSNPDVVVGEQGWLFYRTAVTQLCFEPVADLFMESVTRADQLMRSLGRDLVILVAPDKAAVYADLAPDIGCAVQSAAAISAAAQRVEAAAYPFDELQKLRWQCDTCVQPYYQWDSHWSQLGAAAGAKAIVEILETGLWSDGSLQRGAPFSHIGDLSNLVGIARADESFAYTTHRQGVQTARTSFPVPKERSGAEMSGAWSLRFDSTSNGPPLLGGVTLILHDSFGVDVVPLLSPYFETLISTKYNGIDDATVDRIRGSRRLVIEFVQRNYWNRVKTRPLDGELATVFEEELSEVPLSIVGGPADTVATAHPPANCPTVYLAMDRPREADSPYAIGGSSIGSSATSRRVAVYSADHTWRIENATSLARASIRAIAVCK